MAPPKQRDHDPREDISISYENSDEAEGVFTLLAGGWEWYALLKDNAGMFDLFANGALRQRPLVRFPPVPYYVHRNMQQLYRDGRLIGGG